LRQLYDSKRRGIKQANNMTPAEREFALHQLTESREGLLRMAQGLSREQWHYRSAPGRWTVAECVEHIVTVEARLLDRIQKSLEKEPDPSKHSALEGQDHALIAKTVARVDRFQAPEVLVPTGRWPHEQLLPEFEVARRLTRDFAVGTQADLRRHFFKHPIFGDLDLYQWLLLIAAHCDRHRVQCEEVMSSPAFPRAQPANANAQNQPSC
jgi:uncharacterized damage-inducible protein DinB